jgi:hypothetical protein
MIGLLLWAQTAGAIPLPGHLTAPDAPSTGTIAYQGRLADAGGNPLTATVNMEFRLYSAATGGAPLWSELWTGANGVQVSDGLFNVMLGSLTPIPQNIMTGNSSLWLGITAGTDDEMMPRVQLGSVPFAVQALTVPDGSVTTAKIANAAVSQAKLAAGSVASTQIADAAVTNSKLADGAVTDSKLSIWDLTVGGRGRFGTPGASSLEGGEIQLAEVTNGPRWHFDNYVSNVRWFSCLQGQPTCNIAMSLSPQGNWSVLGTKSAIVQTSSYGQRKLYAIEAPDVRFTDEGRAQLSNGEIRVGLDPIFVETIEGDYLVQVTPYGDASLYVADMDKDYFVVRAREGDQNVSFAWRLSATRKDYAGVRLEQHDPSAGEAMTIAQE